MWKEDVANFEKDLEFGKRGEEEFYKQFKDVLGLKKEDGYNRDFSDRNGDGVELKTDRYDMNKTSNFFIERFSYDKKVGGPWQAFKKGNKYFCYWFYPNDIVFLFELKQLINKLNMIEKRFDLVNIKNQNHITQGYKIPRKELKDIYTEYNLKDLKKSEEFVKDLFE